MEHSTRPRANGLKTETVTLNGNQGSLKMKKKDAWTALDYFNLLNINSAKIIAMFLVIFFMLFHGIIHWFYGVTPCKGLLEDGMYKKGGGGLWQPWGCMMHQYSQIDADKCFRYNAFYGKKNHFVFIGDSRMEQLYMSMKQYLSGLPLQLNYLNETKPHHDVSWTSGPQNLQLEFFWAPILNGSVIEKRTGKAPSILVLGSCIENIKSSNDSADALEDYEYQVIRIKKLLENISSNTKTRVLWVLEPHVSNLKLDVDMLAVTNEAIDRYRKVSRLILDSVDPNRVILWSSLSRHSDESTGAMPDGFHLPLIVLKQGVLMMLNLHCNDNMNFNDGSCCKSSDVPTGLQQITFFVFAACGFLFLLRRFYIVSCQPRPCTFEVYSSINFGSIEDEEDEENSPDSFFTKNTLLRGWTETDDFLFSVVKMGLILWYFYVCDRTNFFMKENKYFTHLNFWVPVLYVAILGMFFHDETKQNGILNRDQTDEWKGWMQLMILIYHMTGGSKSLPIYMIVRILVSGFLFLNGYGHFCYFWAYAGDPSPSQQLVAKSHSGILYRSLGVRYLQVLFRMNFLTILLCLAMNRPYQFYYFVPLVSFWFTMQYAMMICPPKINGADADQNPGKIGYVVLKFIIFGGVTSVLFMSEIFFEKVFVTRPWKALFVTTDDDITEWWFRWKLDRYTTLYGMLFGLASLLARKLKILEDIGRANLCSKSISIFLILSSVLGILSYVILGSFCQSKEQCNEVHPYIVFVPLVSFVMLRNVLGPLRARYSSLFAWLGKISLELFIAQYHIWLAADTHGVLVLIPNYPVINVLLTSFIFVCAAHEIHKITEALAPVLVPNDYRLAWRNCAAFLLILVPIGINDGMF